MAMAARIPMIATTIINSIRVKPLVFFFFISWNMPLSFPRGEYCYAYRTAILVPTSRVDVIDIVRPVVQVVDVPDIHRTVRLEGAPRVGAPGVAKGPPLTGPPSRYPFISLA